ncbi:uncharacterized protein Dwil_GK18969 [Drosophila willistoni]|uniref:Uncharacterized protein n=1 Tax=Drosophila willistoni TaxID=7260 RepID=B4NL71_DROWI|nr:uncharacterized protein Dwil_GK18969 [Drosophila willistoni]
MWSPSTPKKRYSTPILPLCIHQGFIPPCEEKEESANMTLILAWEYGRNWLQQRDEFLRNKKHIESKKYVQPDIAWWLRQRKRTSFNPPPLRNPKKGVLYKALKDDNN